MHRRGHRRLHGEQARSADRPAYVALLAASNAAPVNSSQTCAGGNDLDCYRDLIVGNEPSASVQRINYDTALNGRLIVYGLGGNDAFFTDDNSAITTLDGGSGADSFNIGQIFGSKRDVLEGGLAPQDVFPVLIATTRGWLSPGIHAPLVAQGGTGNDEFTVFSNQAELRLEGDDDNDIFVVRAFALAAVVDTDANGDGLLNLADIEDPFGTTPNASGVCTDGARPEPAARRLAAKDNNGDGVCNAADAHMTGAETPTTSPTRRSGRTTSSRSTATASRGRSSGSASRPPGRSTSARAAARTRSRTTSTRRCRSTAARASTRSSSSAPSSPTTS